MRRIFYFLFVLIQIVFLLGMMGFHQNEIQKGYPLKLTVFPRDPDSLLRGEYAHLRYEIESIDLNVVSHDMENYERNMVVYVTLGKDTQTFSDSLIPLKVSQKVPPASEYPFIKGNVLDQYKYETGFDDDTTEKITNDLQVEYSINQYFVQEGRSQEIESIMGTGSRMTTHKVLADVRLSDKGIPYLTGVFIDGKLFK